MISSLVKQRQNTLGQRVKIALTSGILLTAFAIAPFIVPSQAQAWTGVLPSCNVGGALDWEWKEAIKDQSGGSRDPDNWNGALVIASFDNLPESTSFTLLVYFAEEALFVESGANRSITLTQTTSYQITKNPALSSYKSTVSYNGTVQNISTGSFACVTTAKGSISYENDWEAGTFSEDIPAQINDCDTLDIACQIGNIFSGVRNTFVAVGQAIVNGIASLFVPSSEFMTTEINDFSDFLEEKLGFLVYPIQFSQDLIEAFDTSSGVWCTESSCIKYFGDFYGGQLQIDFLAPKWLLLSYWNYALIMLRALIAVALIFAIRDVLMRILKK